MRRRQKGITTARGKGWNVGGSNDSDWSVSDGMQPIQARRAPTVFVLRHSCCFLGKARPTGKAMHGQILISGSANGGAARPGNKPVGAVVMWLVMASKVPAAWLPGLTRTRASVKMSMSLTNYDVAAALGNETPSQSSMNDRLSPIVT